MSGTPAMVHPTSVVEPGAELGEGVEVGPFSIVGAKAVIGAGTKLDSHCVVDGDARIGEGNRFYPFCVIGYPPQDLKYAGEPTRVEIGDRNVFREYCQVHRGTEGGGGLTRIGDDCYFMVSSHVAHDCVVGDHALFANAATLAGHVEVGPHATIGAYSGVHQFCRVGEHAFIGGYSVVTRDAMPYCLTVGNRASCFGLNRVGLKRKGFSSESIRALDKILREVFLGEATRSEALEASASRYAGIDEAMTLIEFIRSAKRGVIPLKLGTSG